MTHLVYLAGSVPKGKEDELKFIDWRKDFQSKVKVLLPKFENVSEIVFLDPSTADLDSMPLEKFFGRDVHMIKISDVLVIDVREKAGVGTSQEFIIAKYYNKPVITICPKGSHYNRIFKTNKTDDFHFVHPFITATADVVVEDFEEAANALLEHLSGNKRIKPKSIDVLETLRKDYKENFVKFDVYLSNILKKIKGDQE